MLGKINTTQQLLCIQIPCIFVQDNHNEWKTRIYLATIWSYCFLHSLKSFAKTNLAKIAKKKTVGNTQAIHMVWETTPKVYCQRHYKLYVNAMNHTFWLHLWYIIYWTDTYNIISICSTDINPLKPKSDQHLISPYNIFPELYIKVMRIKKMVTREENFWLANKFSLSAP